MSYSLLAVMHAVPAIVGTALVACAALPAVAYLVTGNWKLPLVRRLDETQ